MLKETEAFSVHILRDEDAQLSTLLTAPYTWASGPLLAHYGVGGSTSRTPERAMLDAGQRAGFLTQGAFVTVHTSSNLATAAPRRGRAIRNRFLCSPLDDPPADTDLTVMADPDATARVRLTQKTSAGPCAGCHALINPIGFVFEHYDAIGRYRTTDEGLAIDASGDVPGSDVEGPLTGVVELAARLAESDDTHRCMVSQWWRYAFARAPTGADRTDILNLEEAYDGTGRNLLELVIAITRSDPFRHRRVM